MAPARRLGRVTGRRVNHDVARHRFVVQKAPIGHVPRAVAAEPAQTGRALGDERVKKLGPPPLQPFVAERPQIDHSLKIRLSRESVVARERI